MEDETGARLLLCTAAFLIASSTSSAVTGSTGGNILLQPSDVTELPEVLEYNAMTTQSAEMLNEEDKVRVAAAEWINLFLESDVNFRISE